MATKSSKRRVEQEEKPVPVAKRGRRAAKSSPDEETVTEVVQEPVKKPVGRPKGSKNTPKKDSSAAAAAPATRTRRGTLGVNRRVPVKNPEEPGDTDDSVTGGSSSAASPGSVKTKIRRILENSKKKEAEIIAKGMVDGSVIDSEDEVGDQPPTKQQATMAGRENYTKYPDGAVLEEVVEFDKDDDDDEEALDLTTEDSKMRMSIQDTSVFDDPNKSSEEWWLEDPTREITLCELWRETKYLYDFSYKGHMTEDRTTTMKRFATILQVPPNLIETRMSSMRNMYQRLHRQCKSGSEPVGRTDRQAEVLRLLYFLRQHIKTSPSLTSYKGSSPAKSKTGKVPTVMKSTPKPASTDENSDVDEEKEGELNISEILEHTLTPMNSKANKLHESEEDSGSESEFQVNQKHFGRNNRLLDEKTVNVSVRRSLRLPTPSPPTKKTNNTKLVKSSKKVWKTVEQESPACSDSEPLATTIPKKVAPKPKPKSVPKKATNAKDEVAADDNTDEPEETTENVKTLQKAVKKTKTAKERLEAYKEEKADKEDAATKVEKRKPKQTTAAERKELMASTSSAKGTDKAKYGVTLEQQWHDKQGPAYRKIMEQDKKKKEKDKDEKFAALMQEKNDNIRKLTEGLGGWNSNPSGKSASVDVSPEQLAADSLVPHLKRMDQDIKDMFMLHVLSLAFKAVRGKWPE